jgi:hypothetical protein
VRHAPPVGVTLSGAGAWRHGRTLLGALTAAVFAAWGSLHLGAAPTLAAAAGGAAALLAGGLAWRAARPQPAQLRWDGASWSADAAPGEVDVMLDLQRWLLLRFRPAQGRARWLPVPAAEAGAAWLALRAALYSRAEFALPPAPERPPD